MSIHISKRVWRQSTQHGTAKLLLLALAEYANDAGICWPSATTLARDIQESERYTRILLRKLLDSGELVARHGGGRGRKTVYGVVVGMTDQQRAYLNSELEISVFQNTESSENSELEISELSENTDPEFPKTLIYSYRDEAPNSASGRAETAQNQAPNHHGNNHDLSPPPPTQPPRANAASAAGGGGEAAQEAADPVYAVFANPRYGITEAQRLAHQWAGQDAGAVGQLVERLYAQHHDPTNPRYTGGRLYRALKAGPGVLLKPPPVAGRAPPIYTPPTRAAPTDPDAMRRALAAARTPKARDPVET